MDTTEPKKMLLHMMLVTHHMTEGISHLFQEEEILKYVEYILTSLSPVYNYLEDLDQNEEKLKDVINIIDAFTLEKKK